MADVIEAEHLTKSYGKERGVIDLSFSVRPGEVFGYLGPNGAGKTTTIRTMLDFIRPTTGRLSVFGLDSRQDSIEIHRRIGYLPGERALYERLTGTELLSHFAALRGGVDWPFVRELAERLDCDLGVRIRSLSHGNKQKVGLIQAFMHRPELLILDEPTQGLDPLVQQAFHEIVEEVRVEGRTVFLSSHVLSEVERLCDRVGIIREGRLIAIEDIGDMRARALRTLEFHFAGPVPAGAFAGVSGVREVEAHGDSLRLTVEGPLDAIVKAAARFEVWTSPATSRAWRTSSSPSTGRVRTVSVEAAPGGVMFRSVLTKTVHDQRRALTWWSLGVVLTVLMYAAFWPSVRENAAQFTEYMKKLPEAIRNLLGGANYGTPEGYIQAELFSLLGPILLLVYAIGAGARSVAGEEEAGTLDLLLSTPVSRRRVLVDKFTSMVSATLLLATLTWLSLVAIGPLYQLHLGLRGLVAATLNLFLLAVAFGTVALLVGAATGSKGAAIGVSSGVALITFVLNTLAPTVDALRPVRFLSPFHYYSSHRPLTNGFDGLDILVLGGIAVVALMTALHLFERRDLAA